MKNVKSFVFCTVLALAFYALWTATHNHYKESDSIQIEAQRIQDKAKDEMGNLPVIDTGTNTDSLCLE